MTSVFIGGSRRIGCVAHEVAQRLDNVVARGLRVLVGDANGFDRAAQTYLAGKGYEGVVVYCTAGACRNNVGNWPRHDVSHSGERRDRAFYTAKDDAMLEVAEYGLFAWDGQSKGTLRNIRLMAERGKPSLVYLAPARAFFTVRAVRDLESLATIEPGAAVQAADLFAEAPSVGDGPPAPRDSIRRVG